jgi:hypothetical protein
MNNSFAQSTATVNTPKGTPVTVLVLAEMSQSAISSANAQALAAFPNATIVSDASAKYNCHAYAWYLTECSNCTKYWMNTPGDDTYWQDCSYVEVSAAESQKISYSNDDHSAVKSVVSGKYESKWGQWPVMRHNPTDTPYNSTNLKYYVKAQITGISEVCTSATYNLNAPAGSTVTWSISPSNAASFPSGSSTSKTFTKIGTFRGNATITATLNSSACGAPVVITKQVFFGLPFATTPTGPDLCINIRGGEEIYVLPVSAGATSYTLSSSSTNLRINGGTSAFTTGVAPLNIRFRSTVPGNYTVTLTTTNACGSTATNFTVVARNCSTGGGRDRMYMVYPNPVDTELNIAINDTLLNVSSFQKTDSNENIVLQKEVPFIIILHDFEGRLVKQQQFSKLGDIQKVEVSDLKKGIYFLKIIARELEETHRIIIE